MVSFRNISHPGTPSQGPTGNSGVVSISIILMRNFLRQYHFREVRMAGSDISAGGILSHWAHCGRGRVHHGRRWSAGPRLSDRAGAHGHQHRRLDSAREIGQLHGRHTHSIHIHTQQGQRLGKNGQQLRRVRAAQIADRSGGVFQCLHPPGLPGQLAGG